MSIFSRNKHKPYWSVSMNKALLMEKSPKELEKIGRENGIEIYKRKKIQTLVDDVYASL